MNSLSKLTKDQKRAIISKSKRICVIATAGSGKTKVLADRLCYLIEKKSTVPNSILALTFTNKAKDEITKRVESLLSTTHVFPEIRTIDSLALSIAQDYTGKTIDPEHDIITYGEILKTAIKALQDKSFGDRVRNQYTNLLIDEFQDINPTQFLFLTLLLTNDTSLFVVGDDDQNIYQWRESTSEYLINFKSYFPSGEIIVLDECFRCSGRIVDAMNMLISNNKHRYPKTIKTSNPLGKQIEYTRYHSLDDEISSIVASIKAFSKEGYNQKSIAVLLRKNDHTDITREKLEKNGLKEVDVATIHSSKGNEYDIVFVAGLNDNLLPFFESKKNSFDDERNVLFVAISRAKKMLFLSSFMIDEGKGFSKLYKESRFINEIRPLLKTQKTKLKTIAANKLVAGKRYYFLPQKKMITYICSSNNRYIFGDRRSCKITLTKKEISRFLREKIG